MINGVIKQSGRAAGIGAGYPVTLAVIFNPKEQDVPVSQVVSQKSIGRKYGFYAPFVIEIPVEQQEGDQVIPPETLGVGQSYPPLKIIAGFDGVYAIEFVDRVSVLKKAP